MSTYRTTKGNELPLTPHLWRGIKRLAKQSFDGSEELFNSCWRDYKSYLDGAINDPEDIHDVIRWLDEIASEKVNDSQSRFYIYG